VLHENAWTHFPPWQFVEQQSTPVAQTSPSVLHALVPVGVGSAWHAAGVPEQRPVQHSVPAPQVVPVDLQVAFAQRPPTQDCEQHSPGSAHAAPGVLQNAVVVHVPAFAARVGLLQAVEQHSPFAVQTAPLAAQVETGVAHACVTGLQ
jgi:hypothetical protein